MATAIVVFASLAGCGSGSDGQDSGGSGRKAGAGADPRILAETIARDLKRQNGGEVLVRCRRRAAHKYECVSSAKPSDFDTSESGEQQSGVVTVTVADDGAYRGVASGLNYTLIGSYPRDVAYRGLDLVALMRAVYRRGHDLGEIAADEQPGEPCEVGLDQDRSYECYIPRRTRGNAGGTHTIVVADDGRFTVDEEGDALSGQLPASLSSPGGDSDKQPADVVRTFQRAVADKAYALEACSVVSEKRIWLDLVMHLGLKHSEIEPAGAGGF